MPQSTGIMATDYNDYTEELLRSELRKKDIKIDHLIQEAYSLKMTLNGKASTEEHLQSELESLQQALTKATLECDRKINIVKTEYKQRLDQEKDTKVKLETEMSELKTQLEKPPNHAAELELVAVQQELRGTEEQLAEAMKINEDLQLQVSATQARVAEFEEEAREVQTLLSHSREQCATFKEELATVKEELEMAQGDALAARLELQTLGTQKATEEAQDSNKRGNSLFSEVDDKYEAAIKSLRASKQELIRAKQELSNNKQHLQLLKVENARQHREWQKYEEKELNLQYLDSQLMQTHLQTIDRLERSIQVLQKELEAKAITLVPNGLDSFQWLTSMIEKYRRNEHEISNKNQELYVKMRLLEDCRLREKLEEHRIQAANMRLNGEVKELKIRIEQLSGNTEPTAPGTTVQQCNCAKQPERRLPSFMIKKKEEPKTVRFDTDPCPMLSPIPTLRDKRSKTKCIKTEIKKECL
ncbi:hypothetical protein B566_EDAN005029 [Ephemera danica]|nr:hypothetical protein B566_EDAN005029 [Ephemera danica]